MSDIAILCESLGKRYRIGQRERYKTLRDTLAESVRAPIQRLASGFRGSNGDHGQGDNTFWALKDVSFEVRHGEVIGIIGRNGAGKSTLLKILSRITKPTTGKGMIHGRVGSLLEVGTGFHPELTGRENILLNGAILGMRRAEIERKFDEIVAFAEIDKFLDTTVKHYSSGMYVRLAFAVAAHMEPEILLVDEVLAVGDAGFQKKCLGKMGNVAREGRTVLFVSHNMTAVQSLCDIVIWLDKGRVVGLGESGLVVSQYLKSAAVYSAEQEWPDLQSAPGNESVRLHRVRVRPMSKLQLDQITVSTAFAIETSYWNLKEEARLNLSLVLYNQEGVCVFASNSVDEPKWHGRPFPEGLFQSICHVPGNLLNDGVYRVVVMIVSDTTRVIYRHEDAVMFEIYDDANRRGDWYGKQIGVVRPQLEWSTELLALIPKELMETSPIE